MPTLGCSSVTADNAAPRLFRRVVINTRCHLCQPTRHDVRRAISRTADVATQRSEQACKFAAILCGSVPFASNDATLCGEGREAFNSFCSVHNDCLFVLNIGKGAARGRAISNQRLCRLAPPWRCCWRPSCRQRLPSAGRSVGVPAARGVGSPRAHGLHWLGPVPGPLGTDKQHKSCRTYRLCDFRSCSKETWPVTATY